MRWVRSAITTRSKSVTPCTTSLSSSIKKILNGSGSIWTPATCTGHWRPSMTDLPINYNRPLIMHIDLNSCFAIIEQQANPLLRHKPVAIAAYDTPRGAVIASSYEAKALGIKLGVNVREARLLYLDVTVMMPDPHKYFCAQRPFKHVLLTYTTPAPPHIIT